MAKKPAKPRAPRTIDFKPPGPAVGGYPPPLPLDAILGHSRPLAQLRAAMSGGRLHHGWTFEGPRGVGKFTTALAFAAALLTPPAPAADRVRALLAAGSHPDLHVVTKELARISSDPKIRDLKLRNIPRQVLREFVIEPASRTRSISVESPAAKVFIIDEADLMDLGGQDTLLKTLEEPPAGTVLILASERPERIRPTIRSRCQRIAFGPVPAEDLARWSAGIDGPIARLRGDRERFEWALRLADGSPGMLAIIAEGGLDRWRDALEPMLRDADRGRFPIDFAAAAAALVEEWAKAQEAAAEGASKEAATRAAFGLLVRLLADRSRAHAADDPAFPAAIDALAQAERTVDSNVQVAIVLDDLAARLTERKALPA